MIAIFFLSICKPNSFIFCPSISIWPSLNSTILKRAYRIELFPAPVLPTIPTFIPGSTSKLKFFRDGSKSSLYLIVILEKVIFPVCGHFCAINFLSLNFSISSSILSLVYSRALLVQTRVLLQSVISLIEIEK